MSLEKGRPTATAMRCTVVLVSFIYLITGQPGVHCGIFNAGPYDLKLIRYELCEDQETREYVPDLYMVKRSTHKAFVHGNISLPIDFDDKVNGQMNFSRLGSRGWGKNAYRFKANNFCTAFRDRSPSLFEFFFKAWGIEEPSCPIKAGNYTMDLDTDLPRLSKFPFLPYGVYRVSHALFYGDPPEKFICTVWYASCTERPR